MAQRIDPSLLRSPPPPLVDRQRRVIVLCRPNLPAPPRTSGLRDARFAGLDFARGVSFQRFLQMIDRCRSPVQNYIPHFGAPAIRERPQRYLGFSSNALPPLLAAPPWLAAKILPEASATRSETGNSPSVHPLKEQKL